MQPLFLIRLSRQPTRPFQPIRHVLEWSVRFVVPRVRSSSEPWGFDAPAKARRRLESLAGLFFGVDHRHKEADFDSEL